MGLFPGKEKMPMDEKFFDKLLGEYNFDKKYALKLDQMSSNRLPGLFPNLEIIFFKELST